jgi:type IV pilus assembly protein PilC
MPTYQFEAMDASGQEIRDVLEASSEEEAQATIRQMGYFVTKISVKKGRADAAAKPGATVAAKKTGRTFAIGGVGTKHLTEFTRQLSILQDAGLPILRSLRILENQNKPGAMKNTLMDVCDEIEGGSTLSEAMGKSPKTFNRLYVNMIKAGEAGGALEVILRRLAEFMEKAESLKRKVKGAMVYPVVVIFVAVGILTFIMIKIVPTFQTIFEDFDTELPPATQLLITLSKLTVSYWYLMPSIPLAIYLFIKLLRKFSMGRMGWDLFTLNVPIFGSLIEKNIMARTTRTLGTLVSSGVPILEALNIARETSGNAMFERMYGKVTEEIRQGATIAEPMKANAKPGFHPVAAGLWVLVFAGPVMPLLFIKAASAIALPLILAGAVCGGFYYFKGMNRAVVDSLVVNMVDVGEETGELDTMLYKVADTFDEQVEVITESLMSMLEPLLIIFLGGAVGFIVIALFLPLVALIENLS